MAGTSSNYGLALPVKEDKITESIEQIAENFNIIDTEMAGIANQVSTEVDDKIAGLNSDMGNYKTNLNADITQYKNTVNTSLAQLEVVVGVYTGNGTESRLIDLGFTPVAVEVYKPRGEQFYNQGSAPTIYGGFAIDGYPCKIDDTYIGIKIDTNGFYVYHKGTGSNNNARTNTKDETYYFKAYKTGTIKVVS